MGIPGQKPGRDRITHCCEVGPGAGQDRANAKAAVTVRPQGQRLKGEESDEGGAISALGEG